jgi:hypothetical protein
MMMEVIRSSEISVLTRAIQPNNPEDGILQVIIQSSDEKFLTGTYTVKSFC